MEFFPARTHVWLWIRAYEAYLFAKEDGEGIACSQSRGALQAAWAVHRLVPDGTDYVLFQSSSYGRYLAEIEYESYRLPVQCTYDSPELDNVLFQAVRAEDGSDDIFISNLKYGDWCNPDDTNTPIRWVVEAIPPILLPPDLPHPIPPNPTQLVPILGGSQRRQIQPPEVMLRRTIHYVRADDQGNFNQLQWRMLEFDGQSVFNLRRDLAAELGEANNVLGIKLCVWAGSSGLLIPLVIDLPSNEKPMNIVVLTTDSPDFPLSVTDSSSDDQLMDLVVVSSLPQETDAIYNFLPSGMALHGLPSRIAQDRIGGMRSFLAGVGDPYFLDCFNACLQPIVGLVQQQKSYREFLGNPLEQTVPSTCAIVSSAKCVEVQHRWEYETYYGFGTFPCQAAAPRKLRSLCRREKTWTESDGAYVGDVLGAIKHMGGINTTKAPPPAPYLLPLQSWEQHTCDVLTADRVMELLDTRGPFIGTLWLCPWYDHFDATEDGNLVYRSGCARFTHLEKWSERCFGLYKVTIGLHSVVCFAYRVVGGELHVLILDNQPATGPERWIHYSEILEVHTVTVKKLDPPVHLGGRTILYPSSSYI